MAMLNVPPAGAPSGNCPLLEGSNEDKLVVYYSLSGTNGPWIVAQILSEGLEFPTDWTRKTINLAGIDAVGNNPDFAVRFQWQFNTSTDTGRLDDIRVLSGAVTAQLRRWTRRLRSSPRLSNAQSRPGAVCRMIF